MSNFPFLSSAFVLITLAGPTSEASAADQRFMQGSDYGAPRLNPTTAATLESCLADLAQSVTALTNAFSRALQEMKPPSAEEGGSAKSGNRTIATALEAGHGIWQQQQQNPNICFFYQNRLSLFYPIKFAFLRPDSTWQIVDQNELFTLPELQAIGTWNKVIGSYPLQGRLLDGTPVQASYTADTLDLYRWKITFLISR